MNTYRVYDLRDSLFAPDTKIAARSPLEAVKLAGYEDIKRDFSGRVGDVVVRGLRGSYVYIGRRRENKRT